MNALGAAGLSTFGLLILFGQRRWALLGMVAGILYLTTGLAVSVAGFALYPMRILVLVAVLRILLRREQAGLTLNRLDRAVIVLYAFSVTVFLLRSDEGHAFQIGLGVDALLLYWVFRVLVKELEDVRWLLGALVVLLAPFAVLVWVESLTFQNPFARVNGVELIRGGDLWIREGRLRATGSFGHPSLMGTIGGAFLPLYIGLLFARPPARGVAILGIVLCLAIVGASNSGGPLICVVAALFGWSLWPMRHSMAAFRVILALTLGALALVMKAPIWYLLARISNITGGDGHHRAVLLDVATKNLDQWWLAGMPARDTGPWLPYTNTTTGAVDITNNFLSFGVNAGLGAVILLIALLTIAFSQLGRAMAMLRTGRPDQHSQEPLYWGLGVMLGVHLFNWFGITYWDQSSAVWFLHLAMIGSLCHVVLATDGPQVNALQEATEGRLQRLEPEWDRPTPDP